MLFTMGCAFGGVVVASFLKAVLAAMGCAFDGEVVATLPDVVDCEAPIAEAAGRAPTVRFPAPLVDAVGVALHDLIVISQNSDAATSAHSPVAGFTEGRLGRRNRCS